MQWRQVLVLDPYRGRDAKGRGFVKGTSSSGFVKGTPGSGFDNGTPGSGFVNGTRARGSSMAHVPRPRRFWSASSFAQSAFVLQKTTILASAGCSMMTFISLSGFSAGVSCSNFWVTDLLATSFVSAPPTKICIAFGLRYDLASCCTSRGHVAVKKRRAPW